MGDLQGDFPILEARRVSPTRIAQDRNAPGFVMGYPMFNPVPKPAHNYLDVVDVGFNSGTVSPTSPILQALGQIPVIECDERRHILCSQRINESIVVIESWLVDAARSQRNDARPS